MTDSPQKQELPDTAYRADTWYRPDTWYRGDFHAHTTYSDGHYPPMEFIKLPIAGQMDFVSITDHNVIGAWDEVAGSDIPLIMPGVEVTLHEGHYNVFPIVPDDEAIWTEWLAYLEKHYVEGGNNEGIVNELIRVAQKY